MIADCHMHTEFSADSATKITDQVERAIQLGLPHICFTDHMDMDYPGGDFQLNTESYVKRVLEVQEEYKDRISIGLGVEVGLQEHLQERLQEYIHRYPFDFVIGSMHLIYGEDPYFGKIFDRIGDGEAYREYFQATHKALKKAPDVHTLGHLDYVVRYGIEQEKEYSYRKFADEIDEILKILIERGKGLEVNTAGLKYGLPFAHPHPDILKRYRELGGEIITVGSDAHRPEHIAYEFAKIAEILQECGFRYYAEYRNRHPEFYPIL